MRTSPAAAHALLGLVVVVSTAVGCGADARTPYGTGHDQSADGHRSAFRVEANGGRVAIAALGRPTLHISFARIRVGNEVIAAPPVRNVVSRGARTIVLRELGVTEWYEPKPTGVEQGITLDRRLQSGGGHAVALDMELAGARAEGEGAAITLRASDGSASGTVTSLVVRDARGVQLPARLSSNGTRVSIHFDDTSAVYPIEIDPLYGIGTKLFASAPKSSARFGQAVAVNGDVMVAGTSGFDGAAYVLTRTSGTWGAPSRLVAADGIAGFFGASVATDGTTIAIGAPGRNDRGAYSGAVFVFTRSGTTWTQQAKLLASDGVADDALGTTVAIAGDSVVAGATGRRDRGASSGAAYVFVRSGTAWTQQAKLLASDGTAGQSLGGSIALEGNTVVAGAPGTLAGGAYVFVRTGTTWSQQAKLAGPGGVEYFGSSAAISGESAAIGAFAGASVFVRSGTSWTAQVLPSAARGSVGLSGDLLVTGRAGAASLFSRSSGTWTLESALEPSPRVAGDGFAEVVALSGTTAVVGAPYDDEKLSDAGAVHAFALVTPKALGAACSVGGECTSGHCYDGVCCDKVCSGPCVACRATFKGSGTDGTCGDVTAGTDPRSACLRDPGYPASCLGDGTCDGVGACRAFALPGTACGTTACADAKIGGRTCNGSGVCVSSEGTSCEPYGCKDASVCATSCVSDADCAFGHWCSGGACRKKLPLGEAATDPRSCASGRIGDGVCCTTECTGVCETCVAPASVGTCVAQVGAASHGNCPGATTDDPCTARACDGTARDRCAAFVAGVPCRAASCVDGLETPSGTCDGSASCPYGEARKCAPFVCGDTACKTKCASDADCVGAGLRCQATTGSCISGDVCNGEETVTLADGGVLECAPYRCVAAGCRTSCSVTSDCVNGYLCDTASSTCAAPSTASPAQPDSGCAVASSPRPRSSAAVVLAALVTAAAVARRRRAAAMRLWRYALAALLFVGCSGEHVPGEQPTADAAVPAATDVRFTATAVPGHHRAVLAGGLLADVSAEALVLSARDQAFRSKLRLSSIGRTASVMSLSDRAVRASGSRVEIDRGPVAEWYVADDHGIEQGFLLRARPEGDGDLRVTIAVEGELVAALSPGGASLRDAAGLERIAIRELRAFDADGRPLAARFESELHGLTMRVADAGARYPVVIDPLYAIESRLGPGPTTLYANFGSAVAVDADTLVVGAPGEPNGTLQDVGAAHVFVRASAGGAWSLRQRLLPSDGGAYGRFGAAVTIAGDTILVGSPATGRAGSVYVFARASTGVWSQQAKLVAPDGHTSDYFGAAIAVDRDTAVVGAPRSANAGVGNAGGAYAFIRSGTTWTLQGGRFAPPVATASESLGASAAVIGDVAYVGAPAANTATAGGSVYAFARSGGTWTRTATIAPSDRRTGNSFGQALAVNAERLVVGAPYDNAKGASAGAVYVFRRTASPVTEEVKLFAADAASKDVFGVTVGLSANTLLAGAPAWPAGGDKGAAYAFVYDKSAWVQEVRVVSSDTTGAARFGASVAISADTIAVGAPAANSAGTLGTGAAYAYRLVPIKPVGAACTVNGECTSAVCSDGVCCDRSCTGPCRACTKALTALPDGTCGALPPGAAPPAARGSCGKDPDYPASCRADGLCDGYGACRSFSVTGTACGATSCTGGVTTGKLCDGAGTCAASSAPCAPYACNGATCASTCAADADCAASHYCELSVCAPKRALGDVATDARHCASGNAADGVCCNKPCDGPCEACDREGTVGTCVVIAGEAKHGTCPTASESDPCTAAACDGRVRDRCARFVVGATCRRATCSGSVAQPEARCDGSGKCPTTGDRDCAPYACEASVCKESCNSAADCAPKAACSPSGGVGSSAGRCVAVASCDGEHTITNIGGATSDCSPYRCTATGCRTECTTSEECVQGTVCDVAARKCVSSAAPADDDGGCALGTAAKRGQGGTTAGLALVVALFAMYRARSRGPITPRIVGGVRRRRGQG